MVPIVIRGSRDHTKQDSKVLAQLVIQVSERTHDHVMQHPSPLSGDVSKFKWLVKRVGRCSAK